MTLSSIVRLSICYTVKANITFLVLQERSSTTCQSNLQKNLTTHGTTLNSDDRFLLSIKQELPVWTILLVEWSDTLGGIADITEIWDPLIVCFTKPYNSRTEQAGERKWLHEPPTLHPTPIARRSRGKL